MRSLKNIVEMMMRVECAPLAGPVEQLEGMLVVLPHAVEAWLNERLPRKPALVVGTHGPSQEPVTVTTPEQYRELFGDPVPRELYVGDGYPNVRRYQPEPEELPE